MQKTDTSNKNFITTRNCGKEIRKTNYFETEMAQHGYVFCSTNEKTFRLLLPRLISRKVIKETKGAEYVIVTRGIFRGHYALEILFEDHTDEPFQLTLGDTSLDRIPPPSDSGRTDLECFLYVKGHDRNPKRVAQFPARFRMSPTGRLPYLKRWKNAK